MDRVKVHCNKTSNFIFSKLGFVGFSYAENIWIHEKCIGTVREKYLLRHEYCHTLQQRREGLICFTLNYWKELAKSLIFNSQTLRKGFKKWWWKSYRANPYEIEARQYGYDITIDVSTLVNKIPIRS